MRYSEKKEYGSRKISCEVTATASFMEGGKGHGKPARAAGAESRRLLKK